MHIRPATLSDAIGLAEAHVRAWRGAYARILPSECLQSLSVSRRAESWRRVLSANESGNAVAALDGSIIGLVSFGPCRDAGSPSSRGELWAIYVDPAHWGQGRGRALMQYALAQLTLAGYTEASVWVLAGNGRAIRFYRAFGFQAEEGVQKQATRGGVELAEVRLRMALTAC